MPEESRGFSSRFRPSYSVVELVHDSSFLATVVDLSSGHGICVVGYQQLAYLWYIYPMSIEDMAETRPKVVRWPEIESGLHNLTPTEGGNSFAQRGIVTMPDGRKAFVKIGTEEKSKKWIGKEISAYEFLVDNKYPFAPELLSTNEDKTGLAITALTQEDGWDWSNTWSKERLDATLAAMDALAAIIPDPKYAELLKPVLSDADNGWDKLIASPEQQAALATKLEGTAATHVSKELEALVERAARYHVAQDTLVHNDIRADNAAWNAERNEVRLIDWNWLQLGDRKIDLSATLVHVHGSGFDVLEDYADRLDPEALHWMAGFWLEAASKPIWPGGPEKLRDTQLRAALTALSLCETVEGLKTKEKMPEVEIVSASLEDAEGVQEVQRAAWLETYPNEEYGITKEDLLEKNWGSPERVQKWRESIMNGPGKTWVARENGKVIGFCVATVNPDANQLKAIYIHPEHQGKGVGSKLMETALAYIESNKDTFVEVAKYNTRAIGFYHHFGFSGNEEIPPSRGGTLPNGKIIPEIRMLRPADATSEDL